MGVGGSGEGFGDWELGARQTGAVQVDRGGRGCNYPGPARRAIQVMRKSK